MIFFKELTYLDKALTHCKWVASRALSDAGKILKSLRTLKQAFSEKVKMEPNVPTLSMAEDNVKIFSYLGTKTPDWMQRLAKEAMTQYAVGA